MLRSPFRLLQVIIPCLLINLSTYAQLCTGTLGDPVTNITFGSGSALIGPPLASWVTNYNFSNTNGPSDGDYSITRLSSAGASDSWHSTTDHTGNSNGYFMVVNASFPAGDFYVDTIHNLCGNTTYEFASWIINLNRPNSICGASVIRPNITLFVEKTNGVVVTSLTTGAIEPTETPTWNQYGLFFTTQPNTHDVVIRMRNNAPGGCGNDLGLDDITFRPCGRNASAYIEGMPGNRYNVCQQQPTSIKLNAMVSSSEEAPSYQWQTSADSGKTWTDIPNASTTNYTLAIAANASTGMKLYRLSIAEAGNISSSCRSASNIDTVVVYAAPTLAVSGNTPICTNEALHITATATTPVQWRTPANAMITASRIDIEKATASDAGKYYATTTTNAGCTYTDSGFIAVINAPPNANAGPNTSVCKGSSTQLQGTGGTIYSWTPANTLSNSNSSNPLATPVSTTTYHLTVRNENNCSDTASVTVAIEALPTANAGDDKWISYGQSVQLNGTVTGSNVTFFWTPDAYLNNATTLTPWATPEKDTTYTLYVTNPCGVATDDVFIKVYRQVEIPNIFSPNGDGIYDTWNIPALVAYPHAEVSIFSRYGMRLYYSQGYRIPWDGTYNNKKVPAGTYYYVIDLKNNTHRLSGSVTVL